MAAVHSVSLQYGMREIRSLYHRNVIAALVSAIGLHLLVIGSYYASRLIWEEEELIVPPGTVIRIHPRPLSFHESEFVPQPVVYSPPTHSVEGIPVPLPDADVSADQTIATQQQLSQLSSTVVGTGTGGGLPETQIPESLTIEDQEPPDFVLVEKDPIPIRTITPEYPEFAKRIGVEGVVSVRIWVDKEGKPKKAVVMKSDNDLLNENALKAAMQFLFTPAVMNNGPVAVWVSVPFRFRLNR